MPFRRRPTTPLDHLIDERLDLMADTYDLCGAGGSRQGEHADQPVKAPR